MATEPNAPDRYSVIDNASLCVNTEGSAPEPLCTITVHCLDDATSGPNCDQQPKNQNWPDFGALFAILPKLTNDHYEQRGMERPFSLGELSRILEENTAVLKGCWEPFRKLALGETDEVPVGIKENEALACVNTPSGWLQVVVFAEALKVDPKQNMNAIAYQFSPLLR